jgi:hypothetical protein
MARPVDASKYVYGVVCRRCGHDRYYPKNGLCVECERRNNARRYARRIGKPLDEEAIARKPPITNKGIMSALSGYSRTPGAHERSKYLDSLILKRPDEGKPPLTAGDVWRSMLPVGVSVKPSPDYDAQAGARHAQNTALAEAIRRILPRLPDIARLDEIRPLLPPDAVEPINASRLPFAIAAALAELGIVPGTSSGRTRLYVIRRKRRYARLSGYALERVKAGKLPRAARKAIERPSVRRAVGQRGAASVNAGPSRLRKTRQSDRTKNNRPSRRQSLRREAPAATGAATLVTHP